MPRQPGHLKSPEQNHFYPQHAPSLEAPYIHSSSSSALPMAQKAWSQQLARDKIEDVERRQRQQRHCESALKERTRLEEKWKLERQKLENARKQENLEQWRRMQADKARRETRWTKKTESHCFHADLWVEDEDLYSQNRHNDAHARTRQRNTDKASLKDQADRRSAKLSEVDVLDNLRKEKKKLQEDQKELKARLDLDKVDKRCASAKYKADMKKEAHQQKLADMGHLDRSHSDFFTEKRLTPIEREKRRQARERMFRTHSGQMTITGQASVDEENVTQINMGQSAPVEGEAPDEERF